MKIDVARREQEFLRSEALNNLITSLSNQIDLWKILTGLSVLSSLCQSALKSIHLTAPNNVQKESKIIPFSAPFYVV